jgi:hypothetical protein
MNPKLPLFPGVKLGSYEIAARLGAGGIGEVCRAKPLSLISEDGFPELQVSEKGTA